MKHYAVGGTYVGYLDAPPAEATEVPSRPLDRTATWDGEAWQLPANGDWIASFCAHVDVEANARAARIATEHHAINDILIGQICEAQMLTLSADPTPTDDEYPLLASLVDLAPGVETLPEAAAHVIATARAWGAMAGPINRVRLTTKAMIAACETSEELQAVLAGVDWPIE